MQHSARRQGTSAKVRAGCASSFETSLFVRQHPAQRGVRLLSELGLLRGIVDVLGQFLDELPGAFRARAEVSRGIERTVENDPGNRAQMRRQEVLQLLANLFLVSFLIRSTPNNRVTLNAMDTTVRIVVNLRLRMLLMARPNMVFNLNYHCVYNFRFC